MSTSYTPIEPHAQQKVLTTVEPAADDDGVSPEEEADEDDTPTPSHRERFEWFDANPDLEECCTANGLTRKQFVRRGDRVTSLEMFLGFWASMRSVRYFGLLQHLSIVKHPTITTIDGLECCPLLESLRIIECGLTHISNLSACVKLTHINLSSNHIGKIENLSTLTSLQVLWLNDNHIRRLSGLSECVQLKQLWLARNDLDELESGFEANKLLEDINVASNRLHSFQSLHGLNKLPALRSLSLSDPHYGDNPVCRLCNYQTYLLCQLPALIYLDTIELTSTNKQVADTTLIKKRMYYNMRIKTIKRNVTNCVRKARACFTDHVHYANFNLNALMRELSDLEKELHLETLPPPAATLSSVSNNALAIKRDCIAQYIQEKMTVLHSMTAAFHSLVATLALLSEKTIRRLVLELNTGGNIRLEDGTSADVWYTSCVDLVKSRAFVADLHVFGVRDVHVHRVARINNRYLRNRFQERMDQVLDGPDDHVKENVTKRGVTVKDSAAAATAKTGDGRVLENALEYLFYSQPPILDHMATPGGVTMREQEHAVECGLRAVDEYAGVADGGIKLSNSLAALDLPRLATALHVKGTNRIDPTELVPFDAFGWDAPTELTLPMRSAYRRGDWRLPPGVVLIAKVFLGHTRQVPSMSKLTQVQQEYAADGGDLQCLQVTKPTDPKQKCYFVLDEALILPEYLVEYEYTTSTTTPMSSCCRDGMGGPGRLAIDTTLKPDTEALQDMGEAFALTDAFYNKYKLTFAEPLLEQHLLEDRSKGLIQMDPAIARRHAVMGHNAAAATITPAFILETSRQQDLTLMVELNLTSCGLKSLQGFIACPLVHLETLVLSFNEIRRIECLDGLVALRVLDLGYNILRGIDNVTGLAALQSLLLNNNLLYRFDDIQPLSHLHLHTLDMRNNAICDAKRYRLHVLQRLPQLHTLDMAPVTKTELDTAMELCTALTPLKIWTGSRLGNTRQRGVVSTLDLFQTTFGKKKRPTSTRTQNATTFDQDATIFDEDGAWWSEVDELHVNHELLTQLTHLDRLTQLRVASFSDNDIMYIDGLGMCTRMEELELLSLEDNEITSLQGLTHLVRLMELYIGNNHISNLKEILHLKSLPKLIIVDFSGNGLCADDEYQLYTIYNLRRVKVLDGVSVTAELQNKSKQ
ncbi:hypothetical protein DYB35_010700, partial [Aphanomyces astaci]